MLTATLDKRWQRAAASFALTLVNYVVWAILNDAAVHGWDDLTWGTAV